MGYQLFKQNFFSTFQSSFTPKVYDPSLNVCGLVLSRPLGPSRELFQVVLFLVHHKVSLMNTSVDETITALFLLTELIMYLGHHSCKEFLKLTFRLLKA